MTKTMSYGIAASTVAGLVMSMFSAAPALACGEWGCGGGSNTTDNSVTIVVENSGAVVNSTSASASTGGNTAGGSYGGDGDDGGNGGAGGDATSNSNSGDATAGDGGTGGDGGNGGAGGPGGLVQTGDADAEAATLNVVNSNDIAVQQADCGCNNTGDSHHGRHNRNTTDNSVTVVVANEGLVLNSTDAQADTGNNNADGSYAGDGEDGGNGGNGGDATANGGRSHHWDCGCGSSGGDATGGAGGGAGNGGNGGAGGVGGTVITGAATSRSGTINVVNTNIVRVTR